MNCYQILFSKQTNKQTNKKLFSAGLRTLTESVLQLLLWDMEGIWSGLSLQNLDDQLLEGQAYGRHSALDGKQSRENVSLLVCTCQCITLFHQFTSMVFCGKQEMHDRRFAFVDSCG